MCRFSARTTGQPPAATNVAQGSFDDMLVDDLSEFNWWDSVEDLTFPLECGDLKGAPTVPEPLTSSPLKSEQDADSSTTNLELLELLRNNEDALKNRPALVPAGSDGRAPQPASSEEQVGFDNAAALGAALQAQRLHAQTQQIAAVQQLAQAAQIQLQAPLLAAMQASQAAQQLQPNFVPGPVATGVPQVPPQQGLLSEQLMALSNAAAMGGPFGGPLVNNLPVMLQMRNLVNSKNHVELDETVEKIKKKRRESAQRSRARKNAYMKSLEVENKQLRTENNRLKEIISRLDRSFLSAAVVSDVSVVSSVLPAAE